MPSSFQFISLWLIKLLFKNLDVISILDLVFSTKKNCSKSAKHVFYSLGKMLIPTTCDKVSI